MSIFTTIFLINIVLFVACSVVGASKLDTKKLSDTFFAVYGGWVLITGISIPVWLIYIIVTWGT